MTDHGLNGIIPKITRPGLKDRSRERIMSGDLKNKFHVTKYVGDDKV